MGGFQVTPYKEDTTHKTWVITVRVRVTKKTFKQAREIASAMEAAVSAKGGTLQETQFSDREGQTKIIDHVTGAMRSFKAQPASRGQR
jgi:hypothetical protein